MLTFTRYYLYKLLVIRNPLSFYLVKSFCGGMTLCGYLKQANVWALGWLLDASQWEYQSYSSKRHSFVSWSGIVQRCSLLVDGFWSCESYLDYKNVLTMTILNRSGCNCGTKNLCDMLVSNVKFSFFPTTGGKRKWFNFCAWNE